MCLPGLPPFPLTATDGLPTLPLQPLCRCSPALCGCVPVGTSCKDPMATAVRGAEEEGYMLMAPAGRGEASVSQ